MKPSVTKIFQSYPPSVRARLMHLRSLIHEVAKNTVGVGAIEETLKWNEPAYLTSETHSGTTLRIAWKPKAPEQYALYVNCNTSLIDFYRALFPRLHFEGNRAVTFQLTDTFPEAEVRLCIEMALTYHHRKASPHEGRRK